MLRTTRRRRVWLRPTVSISPDPSGWAARWLSPTSPSTLSTAGQPRGPLALTSLRPSNGWPVASRSRTSAQPAHADGTPGIQRGPMKISSVAVRIDNSCRPSRLAVMR